MNTTQPIDRNTFLSIDPRLAGVDAMIFCQGDDDHLDLWSRHSSESRHRPSDHDPLEWKQDSLGHSAKIGEVEGRPVWVGWHYAVVDRRVLCFYEITSEERPDWMGEAWARLFSANVHAATGWIDRALQHGGIPTGGRPVYQTAREQVVARQKAEFEARRIESERVRSQPALASAEQVAAGIPTISDDELAQRNSVLRPLVMRDGKLFGVAEQTDLRGVSYAWADLTTEVVGMVAAKTIVTLHRFSYVGLFKPSVAEVLAQAPDDWSNFIAYSVHGPDNADEIGREHVAYKADFHVAVTTYYTAAATEQA